MKLIIKSIQVVTDSAMNPDDALSEIKSLVFDAVEHLPPAYKPNEPNVGGYNGFEYQPFMIPNRYENVIDVTEVKTGVPGATVAELCRSGWEVVGILKGVTQLVLKKSPA